MHRTETKTTIGEPRPAISPRALLGNPEPLGDITVPDGIFMPGLDTSDTYALRLLGRCLEPVASSGEHAIVCPKAPYDVGDFVVLIPKDESRGPLVKRLVMPGPLPIGEAAPAGSNTVPVMLVETVNERRLLQFQTDEIAAVHKVVGFLKRDGSMAEMPVSNRVRRAS